jgi:hypothetical protein
LLRSRCHESICFFREDGIVRWERCHRYNVRASYTSQPPCFFRLRAPARANFSNRRSCAGVRGSRRSAVSLTGFIFPLYEGKHRMSSNSARRTMA